MAAAVAGCTTVVGVDVQFDRSAIARELGATHVLNGAETDAVEEIKDITGCSADYSLDSTPVLRLGCQADARDVDQRS
jgi:aryl-alcohol dehydrogenase